MVIDSLPSKHPGDATFREECLTGEMSKQFFERRPYLVTAEGESAVVGKKSRFCSLDLGML